MVSKVLVVIIGISIVLSSFTLVFAQWTNGNSLGVSDNGITGTGKIVVGEVLLGVNPAGAVVNFDCKMVDNGSSWELNNHASKVIFVIKYTYVNQQFNKQTFRLGYKIWEKSGENEWNLLADKTDVAKVELGSMGTKSSSADTITLDLPSNGKTFKIMLKYDIYGKRNSSMTREIKVERASE